MRAKGIRKKSGLERRIRRYLPIYIMLLLVIAWFFVFKLLPIYGIQLAFKRYNAVKGIWGSPWVGLQNFEKFFSNFYFTRIVGNTLFISVCKLAVSIPSAVLLAFLINELRNKFFKRVFQTVSYLPHFMSWVVLGGIFLIVLSPNGGAVNTLLTGLGMESVYFLGESKYFVGTLVATSLWQSVGWSSIIYLAALAGVSQELHESAAIDGASRLQRALFVSLPALYPTIGMLFTLGLGSALSGSFDQVFNMYNPAVYPVADIIDTFVFRQGILNADFSFTTAVGLFKSVISFVLVFSANALSKKIFSYSMW